MRSPLPWNVLVRWAVVGTLATIVLVGVDVVRTGRTPLNLIQPGTDGPAVRIIQHDFPGAHIPEGFGHDGQMFYAIARQPMHPEAVARDIGPNPRYRLQRILFPATAWVLHPSGGGPGLVLAMIGVGIVGIFVGSVATGMVSVSLGGPTWAPLLFALAPGSFASLRISTADALALALVVSALALLVCGRTGWAVVAGVAAALAREVTLVPLLGLALWRRGWRGACLVAVPAAVAGAWALVLWRLFPSQPYVSDRAPFLTGLADALSYWRSGRDGWSFLFVAGSLVLAGLALTMALKTRSRSPLVLPLVLQGGLLLFLSRAPFVLPYNAARTTMPLLLLASLLLAIERRRRLISGAAP